MNFPKSKLSSLIVLVLLGFIIGSQDVFTQDKKEKGRGGFGGPDGLAIDDEDGLFVAHVGIGSVWGFSRLGEPLWRIRSPAGPVNTNLAFGAEDNRRLHITESATASILTADLPVPGRTMFSHC